MAERLLTQIEAQVANARAALADEDEGKFRTAVAFIDADASDLSRMVAKW